MKINIVLLALYYTLIIKLITSNQVPEQNEQIIMNCDYSKDNNNFTIKESNTRDENTIASVIYNKSYERIGWDYLSISSYTKRDDRYKDSLKAYAMGYLEGILTKNRIYSHYTNFIHYFLYDYKNYPEAIEYFFNFLLKNIEYMNETSYNNMDSDPYWEHVQYVYQQLLGMYDGYMRVAGKMKLLNLENF